MGYLLGRFRFWRPVIAWLFAATYVAGPVGIDLAVGGKVLRGQFDVGGCVMGGQRVRKAGGGGG